MPSTGLTVFGAGTICTVLALTQLGIRQSDWWRVGIRSTNLHIVVENVSNPRSHNPFQWSDPLKGDSAYY